MVLNMGYIISGAFAGLFFAGIRIVRPTQRGLVETLGKYSRFAEAGFCWIIPVISRIVIINTTEKLVDVDRQEIITKDKLNAVVDAQIYYRIKQDEESVKNSQYNVNEVEYQIVNLARTTLRNIIGTMNLTDANSKRDNINIDLMTTLAKETQKWGIEVVRAELKEINPPQAVQNVMNKVVIAENEKVAAIDFATSVETQADGERRAKIKEAEGIKQSVILKAQGEAEAFNLINKSFTGNAQLLEKLKVAENALKNNAKIIIPAGSNIVNVIGDLSGVLPIQKIE